MPQGKLTERDFGTTLVLISGMKFAPPQGPYYDEILRELMAFVGTREQLAWFNDALRRSIAEWPGLPQLRAMFAFRFLPADGIPGIPCEIAGFTAADGEQRTIGAHSEVKLLESNKPRLIEGEISQDAELSGMVQALARVKAMPSTPITRRKREFEL